MKIFEQSIDLAQDLNENKKPDSYKVDIHVSDLRLSGKSLVSQDEESIVTLQYALTFGRPNEDTITEPVELT